MFGCSPRSSGFPQTVYGWGSLLGKKAGRDMLWPRPWSLSASLELVRHASALSPLWPRLQTSSAMSACVRLYVVALAGRLSALCPLFGLCVVFGRAFVCSASAVVHLSRGLCIGLGCAFVHCSCGHLCRLCSRLPQSFASHLHPVFCYPLSDFSVFV